MASLDSAWGGSRKHGSDAMEMWVWVLSSIHRQAYICAVVVINAREVEGDAHFAVHAYIVSTGHRSPKQSVSW